MTVGMPDPLLKALAQIEADLGLSRNTLYTWRNRHESFPPPRVSVGRYSLYDPMEVEAWIAEREMSK